MLTIRLHTDKLYPILGSGLASLFVERSEDSFRAARLRHAADPAARLWPAWRELGSAGSFLSSFFEVIVPDLRGCGRSEAAEPTHRRGHGERHCGADGRDRTGAPMSPAGRKGSRGARAGPGLRRSADRACRFIPPTPADAIAIRATGSTCAGGSSPRVTGISTSRRASSASSRRSSSMPAPTGSRNSGG